MNKGRYNNIRHEGNPFNIDVWYPLVKNITFKSFFIPLEKIYGEIIYKFYKCKNDITYNDIKILETLEKKIDFVIQNNECLRKNGAFIRLIDRSPKDGDPYNKEYVLKEYKKILFDLSKKYNKNIDDINLRINAIDKTQILKIKNGKEALNLLLTSQRTHQDITDWINFGGKEQIVLREWNNELTCDYEFRAFVYNNKITAITQYDHYGVFPYLFEEKEKIETLIHNFWKKEVKNKIKISYYIVDFGYINGKIILIEFSPFFPSTGGGLFDWNYDINELENGNGKLRIREQNYPNLEILLDDWEEQMKNAIKYDEIYNKFSFFDRIKSSFNFSFKKNNEIFLFVASVLKKGFYWNKKFLKDFIDEAEASDLGLLTDESGMGWISKGKKINGEIWKIKENEIVDIEYFYGLCDKKEFNFNSKNNGIIKCIYFEIKEQFIKNKNKIDNYSLDFQNENYNPILHSIIIEEIYLDYTFDYKQKNKFI